MTITPALFLEFSVIGLMLGGVYALIGLCFNFVFKATGVFNFATGAMMMFGAYIFYTVSSVTDLPVLAVLLISMVGTFLLGVIIERLVVRPMLGQPVISMVMVTVGLASILEGLAALIWGLRMKTLPTLFPTDPVHLFGWIFPGRTFWGFMAALSVTLAFSVYFKYSRSGVALRATASNDVNAAALGINVPLVFAVVWGVAASLAAVCGIIVGSINGLLPDIGDVALGALAVVILAGLDSIMGVLLAGLIIGWIEIMTAVYLGGQFREVVPYIAVLVVLVIRPYGLFGSHEVERI